MFFLCAGLEVDLSQTPSIVSSIVEMGGCRVGRKYKYTYLSVGTRRTMTPI